jgi:hypothetical protein
MKTRLKYGTLIGREIGVHGPSRKILMRVLDNTL